LSYFYSYEYPSYSPRSFYAKMQRERQQNMIEEENKKHESIREKYRKKYENTPYQIGTRWYSEHHKCNCKIIDYCDHVSTLKEDKDVDLVIQSDWHLVEYVKGRPLKTKFKGYVKPKDLTRLIRVKRGVAERRVKK